MMSLLTEFSSYNLLLDELPFEVSKDAGDFYYVECAGIDHESFGETPEKAKRNFLSTLSSMKRANTAQAFRSLFDNDEIFNKLNHEL
jgi:hypothetical protein